MTDQQRAHRAKIMQRLSVLAHAKYEAGALEHGGLLSDHPVEWLTDNAIEEVIDLAVYLLTLKEKLNEQR